MTRKMRQSIIILLLANIAVGGWAQTAADMEAFQPLATPPKPPVLATAEPLRTTLAKAPNTLAMGLGTFFWGYRVFLSSQDGPRCHFGPSCSGYMQLAIRRRGLLWGTLAAFDRLVRCNGFSEASGLYVKDTKKGLLIDNP